MDWRSFIAEIVKAVAWPVACVTIVLIFRAPLLRLLPTLARIKFRDFELEFNKELEASRRLAEKARLPPVPEPIIVEEFRFNELAPPGSLARLAETSPKTAITEAWRFLEQAIHERVRASGLKPDRNPMQLIEQLRTLNVLEAEGLQLLRNLRDLRNRAAHVGDLLVTSEQAVDFVQLASRLSAALNKT